MAPYPDWIKKTLAVVAVLCGILGFGVGIAIDINGDGTPDRFITKPIPAPPVPAAVGVDGPDKDAIPDTSIALDKEAREVVQDAATAPDKFDMAGDLRGSDATPVAVHEGPLATPNFQGCDTRILPTNWSNRVSTVKGIAVHYTAGPNLAGRSDMNGLTGFASSPTARVSWHFLIDAEGHCYYSVPLDKKAWTIGNLNSETVNIEVIGTGKEKTYPASSAGARKLRAVVRRLGRIYKIPMRLGATDGRCHVTRRGILTHWMGGPCSGGHVDIKPFDIKKVVAAIAKPSCDTRCHRTRDLRSRHTTTHRRLRAYHCAPASKTRSKRCRGYHATNKAIHRAAKKERITL